MGQQQLLLIILGVIIVGVAVAVGIGMFTSLASDANRDRVVNDLVNLTAKTQQYIRRPKTMGGGGNDFAGFRLSLTDTGNGNGSYSLAQGSPPTGVNFEPGDTAAISGTGVATIYIIGCGKELGLDQVNKMKVYVTVKKDDFKVANLN